jgi:rare lipoprotein A
MRSRAGRIIWREFKDISVKPQISLLIPTLFLYLVFTGATASAGNEHGLASYYADSLDGTETASGELYDKNAMTAAHRTLDFGTLVIVTYAKTGKSVEVRINDRGPNVKDRIIDLSGAAAEKIGLKDSGVDEVSIEFPD